MTEVGWDAEFCMAILDILQKYQARIFMIEQPHPLGFPKVGLYVHMMYINIISIVAVLILFLIPHNSRAVKMS